MHATHSTGRNQKIFLIRHSSCDQTRRPVRRNVKPRRGQRRYTGSRVGGSSRNDIGGAKTWRESQKQPTASMPRIIFQPPGAVYELPPAARRRVSGIMLQGSKFEGGNLSSNFELVPNFE